MTLCRDFIVYLMVFHEDHSVLGPILFLLYVNDLSNVSKFKTSLFADDTNLRLSDSNTSLLQTEVSQ